MAKAGDPGLRRGDDGSQWQPVVAAALAPGSACVFAVVPAVTPIGAEAPTPVEGPAPMAVVPVDGVVLTLLPGVVGPARPVVPLVVPVPRVVLDATLVLVPVPGPVLPSVLEPSVDDGAVVLPQGVPSGPIGAAVDCAKAKLAAVAIAEPASSWARRFMGEPPSITDWE
jgi:hypothetical protein